MTFAKIIFIVLISLASVDSFAQSYNYKVKYGLIQAGKATLVHTVEANILKSLFVIESSPWLSTLWTLSDSVNTEYMIDEGRLLNHTKAIHEGSYHRFYEVTFSDSDQAWVNGKMKEVETDHLRDIPSLLYDLSTTQFHDGDTLRYHM